MDAQLGTWPHQATELTDTKTLVAIQEHLQCIESIGYGLIINHFGIAPFSHSPFSSPHVPSSLIYFIYQNASSIIHFSFSWYTAYHLSEEQEVFWKFKEPSHESIFFG